MSQDNNQNDRQKRQGQGDNWQGESQGERQGQGQRDDWQGENQGDQSSDEMTRESRSSGYSESNASQGGASRQNPGSAPELDDMDESDEDREDDDRGDGSPNRRNNIG